MKAGISSPHSAHLQRLPAEKNGDDVRVHITAPSPNATLFGPGATNTGTRKPLKDAFKPQHAASEPVLEDFELKGFSSSPEANSLSLPDAHASPDQQGSGLFGDNVGVLSSSPEAQSDTLDPISPTVLQFAHSTSFAPSVHTRGARRAATRRGESHPVNVFPHLSDIVKPKHLEYPIVKLLPQDAGMLFRRREMILGGNTRD